MSTSRSIAVRLSLDVSKAIADAKAFGAALDDVLDKLEQDSMTSSEALEQLGSQAGKMGLVAAAGFGLIVGAAANFDEAMSRVQASTRETTGNMELLRDAAIEAGQETKYSATDAAAAIEELAKAGVATADILDGGLSGALNLAAAGNIEVADAAQIAASALTQFRLSGEQVPHVADLLAAGAGKAQGSVDDLSQALNQSGLIASQMGLSIEDTVGTLSAFASAGLLGSDAGTSFKTMLQALTPNSQEAADTMAALGLSFYDAQGRFVGIEEVAGQLRAALAGLSEEQRNAALKTIFGSDAIRAATVLYTQGAEGIEDWTNKVNDQGYAAETASTAMDNLKGDVEQLKGALETAFIGAGDGAQGPLRAIVTGATDAVNAFSRLPPELQSTATSMLQVTAIIGGGLWFGPKVVEGVAALRVSLQTLTGTAYTTSAALSAVATAVGAITVVTASVPSLISDYDTWQRGSAAMDATTSSLTELTNAIQASNTGKYAAELGIDIQRLAQDLYKNGTQGEYASSVLKQLADSTDGLGAKAKAAASDWLPFWRGETSKAWEANHDLGEIIKNNSDILGEGSAATGKAAGATQSFGVAARVAAVASSAAKGEIADLTKAMEDHTSAALGAFDADIRWRQALKDAAAQAADNSAGIRGLSDDAIANSNALSSLASAWNNQAKAVKNNEDRYRAARAAFIRSAEGMGVTEKAAKQLADQVLEIPKQAIIKTAAETAAAEARLAQLEAKARQLDGKQVRIIVNTISKGISGASGGLFGDSALNDLLVPGHAAGGAVPHYGPTRIPAALIGA